MKLNRLLKIPKNRLIKKLIGFDEIYTIAIRRKAGNFLPQGNINNSFAPISYNKRYWYADPLLFSWRERQYLFVEEYDRKKGKGQIAVAFLTNLESQIVFKTIIQEEYHLSFPMVFEWNEGIYMIPESSDNNSINIYKADDFPNQWKLVSCIKTSDKLVDSVIMEKNSDYIVLLSSQVCDDDPLQVRFQRHIIYYDRLNTIIPDKDFNEKQFFNLKDRNAGNIIEIEDEILFPTQESTSIDYGVFLEFRAECIEGQGEKYCSSDIKVKGYSKKSILGIHTYSKTDEYEAIDLRYLRFSPFQQYRKMLQIRKK